jgi:hypothetical protein
MFNPAGTRNDIFEVSSISIETGEVIAIFLFSSFPPKIYPAKTRKPVPEVLS